MATKKLTRTQIHWVLTDHICRHCQGRILMGVANVGPTGGGNPLWKCADCERGGAAMGPEHLCGCGQHFKHAEPGAFMCLKFPEDTPENAWLIDVFTHSGYYASAQDRRGVIGIVHVEFYRQKQQQHEAKLLEKSVAAGRT